MNARETNVKLWDDIYHSSNIGMSYPNDVLVRVSHRLLNSEKHKEILDYGFGGGADFIHFCRKGYQVSGVEISESAITQLKSKLESMGVSPDLQLLTDGRIPFPDNSFDVVVAWQVLYYNDWPGFFAAMKEINRVLRSGGIFLGTMGAVGDFSHTHSRALGDHLYESTVPGQEGAVVIIVDKDNLSKCFPNEKLTIGEFGYDFGQYHGKHWIISYEKGANL
ncbi:hypothetical protein AN963_16465 [Brevibacillus choshinensis]|uniref:Methyltransferase type 11 domain-containing protein n=1 Tax=Brevibacillus choshinensis TaxID=54911 RepID=A0ABR5N7C3_BRECH|nr:class I SAM-dependent methyltransferase [Brevibacillus choshinensis]KQL46520.1 hypothetical protein AN963_16465 [Brevibacillus choshinensis]